MKIKKILITNDDGYESEGLLALADAVRGLGQVSIVAPASEKSACGHSLTLTRPLRFVRVGDDFYKLDDGTPSDCVYLALNSMFEEAKPDIILSGINKGSNMGEDITNKGTASAAMEGALVSLIEMRQREGHNLKVDLKQRLAFLREKLAFLLSRQDLAAKAYEERLRQRMEKILEQMNFEVDEGRILEEVALFSEKTDYTEEVVRFASHLDQFDTMLESEEPIGRKLDFLLQEINREANTTASKASDAEVIDTVIQIKTELEKIREQVQNIE